MNIHELMAKTQGINKYHVYNRITEEIPKHNHTRKIEIPRSIRTDNIFMISRIQICVSSQPGVKPFIFGFAKYGTKTGLCIYELEDRKLTVYDFKVNSKISVNEDDIKDPKRCKMSIKHFDNEEEMMTKLDILFQKFKDGKI